MQFFKRLRLSYIDEKGFYLFQVKGNTKNNKTSSVICARTMAVILLFHSYSIPKMTPTKNPPNIPIQKPVKMNDNPNNRELKITANLGCIYFFKCCWINPLQKTSSPGAIMNISKR